MSEFTFIDEYLKAQRTTVWEDFKDKEREEVLAPLPDAYDMPEIHNALNALGLSSDRLWSHQVKSLDATARGNSVGSTTQTASGKSLGFQLPSLRRMLIDPHSTVLTLFPVKALNSDQRGYWEAAYDAGGVLDTLVKMDGNDPLDTRDELFKDARTLITTPDFFHAWFMRELQSPKNQDFLKHLTQVNVDEAHLYDSYFGTTFSFMMRRVRAIRNMLRERDGLPKQELQIVAASATMEDPQSFLHQLTGTKKDKDFVAIGPDECGSPNKPRRIMRIDADYNRHLMSAVDVVLEILKNDPQEKIILFMDSRRGVEEKTININNILRSRAEEFPGLNIGEQDICLPYRSGYSGRDRERTERRFKNLADPSRVLVSTSASEVGINIPGVKYIVNADVPKSQSSIVQRGGRLRNGGLAVYVGGRNYDPNVIEKAFQTRPKDPVLHRSHEAAQFQSAMCLVDEIRAIGLDPAKIDPSKYATWPNGFMEHYQSIVNESPVPEHLESMRGMGKKLPQLKFSLRTSDGERKRILINRNKQYVTLESLSQSAFMKEAYPGAIFRHNSRTYRIGAETESGNHIAKWEDTKNTTYPISKNSVAVYLDSRSVRQVRGRNKKAVSEIMCDPKTGDFIASVDMSVTGTLLGFTESTSDGDPSAHHYGPKSEYATSPIKLVQRLKGFVMKFHELEGEDAADLRRLIAREFRKVVCDHYDLSTTDIATAVSDITIGYNGFSRFSGDDALVIYDRSASFMGMSQILTGRFERVCNIVAKRSKSKTAKELAQQLKAWSKKLVAAQVPSYTDAARVHLPEEPAEGFAHALYKGSIVKVEKKGEPPTLAKIHGVQTYEGHVLYEVEEMSIHNRPSQSSQNSAVRRAIPASQVTMLPKQFHVWSMVDFQTGKYVNSDAYEVAPRLESAV